MKATLIFDFALIVMALAMIGFERVGLGGEDGLFQIEAIVGRLHVAHALPVCLLTPKCPR